MNKLVEEIKIKNEPIDARFFATKEFKNTLGFIASKNGKKSLNDCIKYIGVNLNLNKSTIKGIQSNYYDVDGAYFDSFLKSYHEMATENQTPQELKKLEQETEITKQVLMFKEKYQESTVNKNHKFSSIKKF